MTETKLNYSEDNFERLYEALVAIHRAALQTPGFLHSWREVAEQAWTAQVAARGES